MLRSPLLILLILLTAVTAPGRTIDVRPGEIAGGADIPERETNLTLTGTLDASDLVQLTGLIKDVTTLDLSGAEIAAYKGERIGANLTSAPAHTLPAGILAGLQVEHLILPTTLTAIGDGALMDSRITDIVIPESVTSIGRSTLAHCQSLRNITLPQSLKQIPDRMAEGCVALTSVDIPSGVESIGDRAFFGCEALTDIHWPLSLHKIGEEAFALSGLERADLSKCTTLSTIGARAFASCRSLSAASLPDDATDMDHGVFYECPSLSAIRLPASAVTIPPLTLKGAGKISSLTLPSGTEVIDTLAFAGMSAIATLSLPASVSHIADGAFENWSGLTALDAGALPVVPTLGEGVWSGVDQPHTRLTVDPALENGFLTTPQWQDFAIDHISGITDAKGNGTVASVTAAFDGQVLKVTSSDVIGRIELYTTDGRLLTDKDCAGQTMTDIDTITYAGPFFIVRVTTESELTPVIFKLLRQP